MEKVWAMKKAVQDETAGMSTLEALRYISKRAPHLRLPQVKRPRRPGTKLPRD